MKVLIIGGIFGGSAEFRRTRMQETTETVLADGLRARGVTVATAPHQKWNDLRGFDLVHLHHIASGCPQFLLRRRIPLVFTRHATKSLPLPYEILWRLLRQRASKLVALSDRERSTLSSIVGSDKVFRIYNGVRTQEFDLVHRSYAKGEESLELLYVGQLVELKRVHLAIDLLARLKDEGHHARLTVITHKEVLRTTLEHHAENLGVLSGIEWISGTTRAGVAHAMKRAHLLVHPSRTEALSTVAIEACFTGLPVLAFNVGGMAEQLPAGWPVYEPSDIASWLQLGSRVANSYAGAVRAFEAHAAHSRELFSVSQMIDNHLALYESVLNHA